MSKLTLIQAMVSASACAVCSMLAVPAAFAVDYDFPTGTYKAQELTLVFDGKGQFQVSSGATTEVTGTYTVMQGHVELTDVKGPWACTQTGQKKGTYLWSFTGTALTFIKQADGCDERAKTLAPVTWQLQK